MRPLRTDLFQISNQISAQKHKPFYLDTNNQNAGRVPSFSAAWWSARPFCQVMQQEILPVDIDSDQIHLLPAIKSLIDRSGLPQFEVASSGLTSQNRHFYIFSPETPERELLMARLKEIGGAIIVRNDQAMRPPGTPHRSNNSWSTPVFERQVPEMLSLLISPVDDLLKRLRPSTLTLLNEGPKTDRSNWDMKVTHRLVGDELTHAEIVQLGLSGDTAFSVKAREKEATSKGSGFEYLLRGLSKVPHSSATNFLNIRCREDADHALSVLQERVQAAHYSLFGGLSAHRVFVGCLSLFAKQSTFERPLAVRTVAETAQVDKNTAHKWLFCFTEEGLLTRTKNSSPGMAATYRLQYPVVQTLLSSGGCESKSVLTGGFDSSDKTSLFRHRYAGESGWRVVQALQSLSGEGRTKDLIQQTGLHSSTVSSALKRLETFEVVEKVSHGVWRLSNTDFVSLSEQWGADIDFKNQQTRHDLDRKSYGAYRLSRSPSQLDDSRQHLTAIDSRTAFDWDTGEILNLDEQWNKD